MTILQMLGPDHIIAMAHMGSRVVIVLLHTLSLLGYRPGRFVLCTTAATTGQNIENTVNCHRSGKQIKTMYGVHCTYSGHKQIAL
jgi:hypothetical protein